MQIGGTNDAFGYAIFCAIKLAGYTGAARVIASIYEAKPYTAWVVGLSRTILGMTTGGLLMLILESGLGIHPFLLLLPVRVAEWWFVIWFFYDRKQPKEKIWLAVILAVIWSYMLDIPAALGFLMKGGMAFC